MLDEHHYKCSIAGGKATSRRMKTDKEFDSRIRKTLAENTKKAHADGKIKYDTFTGKKHTEETKKLMSESKKGTGKGEKNSQYGSCWITRDGENKKIKKQELETFVKEGWEKGRK
jgi:hypothetical protein